LMFDVSPDKGVGGADDCSKNDERHEPDQPQPDESEGRERVAQALAIGEREDIAAEAKEEVDGKPRIGRKCWHIEPMADVENHNRDGGKSPEPVQSGKMFVLFQSILSQ